jgi:protein-disulfide isomerase
MTRSIGVGVVVLTSVLAGVAAHAAGPAPPAASPAPGTARGDVVAIVGGEPITAGELEELAGSHLFQIRTEEYQALRKVLDETIGRRLVEREAAARKIGVDELLKQEVDAKIPPVTEAEQKAFYEQNKTRFAGSSEAEALKRIEPGLRQQRLRERNAAFVESLRGKADVKVMLTPPRLTVEAGNNPARGPADAPVTIIEFSDFQCPYCSRAVATIKKLEDTYPGKIRVVYRDFPLTSIHPQAAKAAEAAACANEQGKFWAMHDSLFGQQDKLQDADLKQRAVDLGLDAAAFDTCLDSGKETAEWQKDQSEGERYGVSSTPAFFVNGRMIVGAQPYEAFARVVDEELARSGSGKDPAGR